MAKLDLTGISNNNEYYTNHYFSTVFEENASEVIKSLKTEQGPPWSKLRDTANDYSLFHSHSYGSSINIRNLDNLISLSKSYLNSLGYPEGKPLNVKIDEEKQVPVFLEMQSKNGAPHLWVILSATKDDSDNLLESHALDVCKYEQGDFSSSEELLNKESNDALITQAFFLTEEPPRFIILIGSNAIALIDRNKWNEKRFLQFEMDEIFGRREETTLQAMSVLLHKTSLCPEEGKTVIDELDENSQKNASGVSNNLKYALRESIELLGNEIIYDLSHRQGIDLDKNPVDANELTIECLRYMYRMLFVLFIEARPELGFAPIKTQAYYTGYSLESIRDIAESTRAEIEDVGNGYYLHETLAKLFDLIYTGYPKKEEDIIKYGSDESIHDMFVITPLKAHIFDPEYTKMISNAKIRNSVMLRIIDNMSLTRDDKGRKGRISYANLGINQMGSVYEALLSYRGFIAEETLYEVKRADDKFDELDVGYFVTEKELDQYEENERVRYESGENKGKLRHYDKGVFIYRLAGREREKSASYYTPEVLTKCLVKYALKELLKDKTADEILDLTVCEPAMGSAAFLNEAINQLAEAYIDKKQKELGEMIPYDKRFGELQKVKMYIADKNVYGIDLNPIAVELAEVSLWLNTIYEGGFVPWFGNQLVNGNSLIGARRQCYNVTSLTTSSKGMRWFENEPERVPLGTERKPKVQVYHFLLGDPGMSNYNDKVIKELEPEKIKAIKNWNKDFTKPYTEGELETLRNLSKVIDGLWSQQVELRKKVEEQTSDVLSVYGHTDTSKDSHTTIRQKDTLYRQLYKSENMNNAGPYARLKLAMDYWCALWFWPIEKADLLPSRSEFFFDMSLILEGTVGSVNTESGERIGKNSEQMSLFASEIENMSIGLVNEYKNQGISIVDIPALRRTNPRINVVWEIANQNKFMHWELEFADLFLEKGGFDLVLGNPPWVKIEWHEEGILSDNYPIIAVKNYKAPEIAKIRRKILLNKLIRDAYVTDYENLVGEQNYLNSWMNYYVLRGQQTDLYKCFVPQGYYFSNKTGVFSFVHPNSIFDDPKGAPLRKVVYKKLRSHYRFENELKLFQDVGNAKKYSLNIYSNVETGKFSCIFNLFSPITIDECYEKHDEAVEGIKDKNGNWNIKGHQDRIIEITKKELSLFSSLFDNDPEGKSPKLPVLHTKQYLETLKAFSAQKDNVLAHQKLISTSEMWHETNSQDDGTIIRNVHFPESLIDVIYSGPHIGLLNSTFQCSQEGCKTHRAYDPIDLMAIHDNYLQRCNYSPNCSLSEYISRVPTTQWGEKWNNNYHIVARKMLNLSGERTLIAAIVPPKTLHINGLIGFYFKNIEDMVVSAGAWSSIVFDFLIKVVGKQNLNFDSASPFPIIEKGPVFDEIVCRTLKLNCTTLFYSDLVDFFVDRLNTQFEWSKKEKRLDSNALCISKWNHEFPLRSDYSRRQAQIEIDVLTAIAIGLSLNDLLTIYRLQFPITQQYEQDTWYDSKGRMVFSSKGNGELTVKREEFESIRKKKDCNVYCHSIVDDTMPFGKTERTIEYYPPFDKCDRETDYIIAWHFFEEKFGLNDKGGQQ